MKTFSAYVIWFVFVFLSVFTSWFLMKPPESETLKNIVFSTTLLNCSLLIFCSLLYPLIAYFILWSSNKIMRDLINIKDKIKSYDDLKAVITEDLMKSYEKIYTFEQNFLNYSTSILTNLSQLCLVVALAASGHTILLFLMFISLSWRFFFTYVNKQVREENKKTYYIFKETYDSLVDSF